MHLALACKKSKFNILPKAHLRGYSKFTTFCFAVRAIFSLFATFVGAPFCFAHSNPRDKSRG